MPHGQYIIVSLQFRIGVLLVSKCTLAWMLTRAEIWLLGTWCSDVKKGVIRASQSPAGQVAFVEGQFHGQVAFSTRELAEEASPHYSLLWPNWTARQGREH